MTANWHEEPRAPMKLARNLELNSLISHLGFQDFLKNAFTLHDSRKRQLLTLKQKIRTALQRSLIKGNSRKIIYLYCFNIVCYMFVNVGYIFLYVVVETFPKFSRVPTDYDSVNCGVIINSVYSKEWFFEEFLFTSNHVGIDENSTNFV